MYVVALRDIEFAMFNDSVREKVYKPMDNGDIFMVHLN